MLVKVRFVTPKNQVLVERPVFFSEQKVLKRFSALTKMVLKKMQIGQVGNHLYLHAKEDIKYTDLIDLLRDLGYVPQRYGATLMRFNEPIPDSLLLVEPSLPSQVTHSLKIIL